MTVNKDKPNPENLNRRSCTECGKIMDADAVQCPHCGASAESDKEARRRKGVDYRPAKADPDIVGKKEKTSHQEKDEKVDEYIDESYPASDAPPWTGGEEKKKEDKS